MFQDGPVATYLVAALVVVAALVGGIVVIVQPETLSFSQYLEKLQEFAIAAGLLAVGRGIAARG